MLCYMNQYIRLLVYTLKINYYYSNIELYIKSFKLINFQKKNVNL